MFVSAGADFSEKPLPPLPGPKVNEVKTLIILKRHDQPEFIACIPAAKMAATIVY